MNSLLKIWGSSCILCLSLFNGSAYADANLNAPQERITDKAINTDLETYQVVQGRIEALNSKGILLSNYALSKAQCWLDVSMHEYTRNDRSAFPQEALGQADSIISALEARQDANQDTPLVNNTDRLREDLWQRTTNLKNAKGFSCYAQKIACAEVELVHAANENKQQGWRHAKPYIQIAEDLIAEAEATGSSCLPPQLISIAPKPVPVIESLDISADALFKFDKAGIDDLLPAGKITLDELMTKLQNHYETIENIILIGYTDRLGSEQYNQRLSEMRAYTVKQYLQSKGLTAPILASGSGETELVKQCGISNKRTQGLKDCLQPNRRVTVEFKGIPRGK